jgi:hypothetical protein
METKGGPQFQESWLLAVLLKLARRDACWRQRAPAFGVDHDLRHPGLSSDSGGVNTQSNRC